MKDVRRILVGVDLGAARVALTPGSRLAVEQGAWLALRLGARLTLLHSSAADERWDDGEGDYVLVPPGLPPDGDRELEEAAAELRRQGIAAEIALSDEKAWLAIVRRVCAGGVDLVIAGKRSVVSKGRHPIGSVSMKLVRNCPCPVWVVKTGCDVQPKRILAAIDSSDVGAAVVRHAATIASRCGAELHVVHALQLPMSVQLEGGEAEYERSQRAERVRLVERQLEQEGFEGEAVFHVGITAPTRAILRCAERIDPELVVMGTIARGGLPGVVVGNTAERLLDRLDCSLLTIKPDDFVCRLE